MEMITRIKLINWASHKETELKFSEGANILIGVMGAGKTSVLDALSFALFGTFTGSSRKKATNADIIRFGETTATVEVNVKTNEGKDLLIIRKIIKKGTKTTTEAIAKYDGKIVGEGSERVTKAVERILGIDYDLYSRAIYAEQNRIDEFMSVEPSKRKDILDRLLGIKKMDEAQSKITHMISTVKRMESEIEGLIKTMDKSSLEKTLNEAKQRLSTIEETYKQRMVEKSKVDEELNEVKKRIIEEKKKKEEIEKIQKEISKLSAIVEQYSKFKDTESLEEKLNSLINKRSMLKEKIEKSKSISSSLTNKMEKLKEEYTTLKNTLIEYKKADESIKREEEKLKTIMKSTGITSPDEIKSIEESLKEELKQYNELIGRAKSKVEEISNYLKIISKSEAKCPVCGAPLTEKHKSELMNKWNDEILNAEKTISETKASIETLKSNQLSIKKAGIEIERSLAKINLLKSKIANINPKELEEKLKSIKETYAKTKAEKEKEEKAQSDIQNEYISIEKSITEINEAISKSKAYKEAYQKLNGAEERLKSIKFDKDEYEKINQTYETLIAKKAEIDTTLESIKRETSTIKSIINEKEKLLSQLKASEERLEKIKGLKDDLSTMKSALQTIQSSVRKQLIEAINDGLNVIWPMIYPYTDYKSIKMDIDDKGAYNFYVLSPHGWVALEKHVSGGERTAFAIALRITLSIVLAPHVGLLILDEPTHNLDGNSIYALTKAIDDYLPTVINQFFIITHEERLSSIRSGKVYVFHREKDSMDPTRVEELR